jgi:hypothetical protein
LIISRKFQYLLILGQAIKEDREKWDNEKLFEGYVTKPINENEVVNLLVQFLNPNRLSVQEHQFYDFDALFNEIELSSNQKLFLNEQLDILLEVYKKIIDNNILDEYSQFGSDLISLGKRISFNDLENYGKTVIQLADKYKISEVKNVLNDFPNLKIKINYEKN